MVISDKSIKRIVSSLKNGSMDCYSVPEKYKNVKQIIDTERELGLRETTRKGYDVIRNEFYVEEILHYGINTENTIKWFSAFNDYYEYLNGQIYDKACYYQYDFSQDTIIDVSKIEEDKSHIRTIDDYRLTPNNAEQMIFDERERIKEECIVWIEKCLRCSTGNELQEVDDEFRYSKLYKYLSQNNTWDMRKAHDNFLIWHYIIAAEKDERKFAALMEYFSKYTCASRPIRESCAILGPAEVLSKYDYGNTKGAKNKQKQRVRSIVELFQDGQLKSSKKAFFDEVCHFYCEEQIFSIQDTAISILEGLSELRVFRFFTSFEDFITYREGDLTNTDLSKDIRLQFDFSKCKKDENTVLPLNTENEIEYTVEKEYSEDGIFSVEQTWTNSNHKCLKQYNHEFTFFSDFVFFLNGDLSGADLLLCTGLKNLVSINGLNLSNAQIPSEISIKFNLEYDKYRINKDKLLTFSIPEGNEENDQLLLPAVKRTVRHNKRFINYGISKERIFYITDIHLLHKLEHRNVQSMSDVESVLSEIVKRIVIGTDDTVLIGGDVSSEYEIFSLFVKLLRKEIDRIKRNPMIIFVLGNHELWDFSEYTFEEIVEKYATLLNEYGMYLLQNNIIYQGKDNSINIISTKELLSLNAEKIREKTKTASIIYFGGLAFSGFSEEFNAINGIYRDIITREEEVEESRKFEVLYNRILTAIPEKPVIVLTHTPMNCWNQTEKYHRGYIYINGHTHRNFSRNTGKIRVYADNQIGYHNNSVNLKWFDLRTKRNIFADYEDGIYKISKEEYQEFFDFLNIPLSFNRAAVLFMLKKKGYYCFICELQNGSLCILNGGAIKKLDRSDIQYYYDHMDSMIAMIENPMNLYTKVQKKIASVIRAIGGSGIIHGCIVDIDFTNHIYVNPVDLKITGYWASNMNNKRVYSNIASFLKKECPKLYIRYNKLLKGNSKTLSALVNIDKEGPGDLPQNYDSTDIYQASREICKMQKLDKKILTVWYEDILLYEKRLITDKQV